MSFELLKTGSFACIATAMTVAGCGEDSPGTGDSGNSTAEPSVRVEVSGAVSSTLAKRGSLYCSASDLGPGYSFELYLMAPPEGFNLVFDRDLQTGQQPIVGSDDDGRGAPASFYYRAPDRRRFDKVENATFVVDSVPKESGQAFIATINATMNDDDGASITLQANINVVAGSGTFEECP